MRLITNYAPPYLAACPICGAVPEFESQNDICGHRAYISCPVCGIVLHSSPEKGANWKEKLVAQWNTRSQVLAPCPLCGGKAILDDWLEGYESGTTITCADCGLMISEGVEGGNDWRNRAIQKWNCRSFTDIRKNIK